MRNVGGSIGISIAQTLLVRRTDVHQNEIVNHVPQHRPAFQNSVSAVSRHFLNGTSGPATLPRPRGQPLRTAPQAASTWAFVDVFRWLSLLSFGCVIVVWFFKKVKPGRGPAGAH